MKKGIKIELNKTFEYATEFVYEEKYNTGDIRQFIETIVGIDGAVNYYYYYDESEDMYNFILLDKTGKISTYWEDELGGATLQLNDKFDKEQFLKDNDYNE